MTAKSTLRAVALTNLSLCMPIGLNYRIKSQARREKGLLILIGLRLCDVMTWALFAAYLMKPTWVSWVSVPIPVSLRWAGVLLRIAVVLFLLFWTSLYFPRLPSLYAARLSSRSAVA